MSSRARNMAIACMAMLIMTSAHVSVPTRTGAFTGEWLSGIRDSSELSGPTLVTGRMVNERGTPVGGRVTAVAWPTLEVLGALGDGDEVKTMAVGKAEVAPDGAFLLRVDPSVPIAGYMEDDGTVNFEIRGEGGGHLGLVSFAGRLDSAANSAWVAPDWTTQAGTARAQTLTLSLSDEMVVPNGPGAEEPKAATDKIFPCSDYVVATYNQIVDSIGEVYTGPHATGDFQYISGSSSSLGVGYSVSGSSGSWSQNGTASASSTATIDYATQSANKKTVFRTTFQYKKYDLYYHNGAYCTHFAFEVRPSAFQGGVSQYTAASAPTASYCSNVNSVPVTLTKNTANAINFTNGLKIGGIIGIDLSTKTGFNSSTKIAFRFSSVGKLCGSNAAWPDAARIVGK